LRYRVMGRDTQSTKQQKAAIIFSSYIN